MVTSRPTTGESGPSWEPGPAASASIWRAISSEPGTGVTVLTMDGRIAYANDDIARMAFGPEARGAGYVGRNVRELFPREWAEERLALLARVVKTGEPVVTRAVWRGDQLVSWLHRIDGDAEASDEGEAAEPLGGERVLAITRRVGGEADLKRIGLSGLEVVESGVVRLGPLDVLTPRELEVLALLGQGLTLQEIATLLFRSHKTISRHRDALGRKLELSDRVKLAELAWKAGLTVRDAERKRV